MQQVCACCLPFLRSFNSIATIVNLVGRIAFDKPYNATVHDIYCSYYFHLFSVGLTTAVLDIHISKKFLIIWDPTGPDFSGWNWVPNILPFSITAGIMLSPYLVLATTICRDFLPGNILYECTKYTQELSFMLRSSLPRPSLVSILLPLT